MLRQRLITGPLLILMLLGLAWLDERLAASNCGLEHGGCPLACGLPRGSVLLAFCTLIVAPLLARELAGMISRAVVPIPAWPCMAAAALGVPSLWCVTAPACASTALPGISLAVPLALVALASIGVMRVKSTRGAITTLSAVTLSWACAGLPWAFWVALDQRQGAAVLAAAILTVKATDIGAYFTGLALGRTKLIPWLSPGKTREGFIGGLIAGAGVGALFAAWSSGCACVSEPVEPWRGALAGAAFGLLGPIGDLTESLLKREARLKDSGSLLPGMGGVFDVADSLLFTAPVAWFLLG